MTNALPLHIGLYLHDRARTREWREGDPIPFSYYVVSFPFPPSDSVRVCALTWARLGNQVHANSSGPSVKLGGHAASQMPHRR